MNKKTKKKLFWSLGIIKIAESSGKGAAESTVKSPSETKTLVNAAKSTNEVAKTSTFRSSLTSNTFNIFTSPTRRDQTKDLKMTAAKSIDQSRNEDANNSHIGQIEEMNETTDGCSSPRSFTAASTSNSSINASPTKTDEVSNLINYSSPGKSSNRDILKYKSPLRTSLITPTREFTTPSPTQPSDFEFYDPNRSQKEQSRTRYSTEYSSITLTPKEQEQLASSSKNKSNNKSFLPKSLHTRRIPSPHTKHNTLEAIRHVSVLSSSPSSIQTRTTIQSVDARELENEGSVSIQSDEAIYTLSPRVDERMMLKSPQTLNSNSHAMIVNFNSNEIREDGISSPSFAVGRDSSKENNLQEKRIIYAFKDEV